MKVKRHYRLVRRSADGRKHIYFFAFDHAPNLEGWNKHMPVGEYYEAIDPVPPEADQVLKLHDQIKRQAVSMLKQMVRFADRGHYITRVRDFLISGVECAYSDIQDAERTQARLRKLPDRDGEGPIESWMISAMNSVSHAFWHNNRGYRATCEAINKVMDAEASA